jgi:hypothetical protein
MDTMADKAPAATPESIAAALTEASGVKKKAKEGQHAYRRRLALAVQSLPDKTWEELPKKAQEWNNLAIETIDAKGEEIPDFDAVFQEPKAKEKKPKADKDKKPAADRPLDAGGVKVRIKKMIVKKPDISAEEIVAALRNEGGASISPFTVSGIRAEFRHSLKLLKMEGWPKVDI